MGECAEKTSRISTQVEEGFVEHEELPVEVMFCWGLLRLKDSSQAILGGYLDIWVSRFFGVF